MHNLSAFGHFFGFTSTINYATSIFKEFSVLLYSLLYQFEVDKLTKEKVKHEQGFPVFEQLLKKELENEPSPSKRNILEQYKNKAHISLLEAQNAELSAKNFINEIRFSKKYKTNFEQKFKPLFPLAGTYSVIFLLFAAFSEANTNDHIICYNTILFVNISLLFLCVINYLGAFGLKEKGVDSRNLVLNLALLIMTFLSWLLALFVAKHPSWAFFKLSEIHTELYICTFLLSCIAFFALAIKIGRVNIIANRKFKKFRNANSITKQYFQKFSLNT